MECGLSPNYHTAPRPGSKLCPNTAFCVAEHEGDCPCYGCTKVLCQSCVCWSGYQSRPIVAKELAYAKGTPMPKPVCLKCGDTWGLKSKIGLCPKCGQNSIGITVRSS